MSDRPRHISEILPEVLEYLRAAGEATSPQVARTTLSERLRPATQRMAKTISTRARTSISPAA
ncbi:hypothetical protein Rhom172_1514 [Rhodothermus marinus SG0.5JP17-172]|uniref:hypothetical protein n=1 Tax=Rhodothermus marinus TaxID=29549 RepID=UPI000223D8DB|nr:hypothetical protein [Rhodothermus marinus]AEN73434.1 hypothetical protein Rhom172_1514 [Rhodothermus marinus SG0.5JP17-172]